MSVSAAPSLARRLANHVPRADVLERDRLKAVAELFHGFERQL